MLRVGLAMLQGARYEHAEALRGAAKELGIDVEIIECRRGRQVDESLHALILPGGESTTMRKAGAAEALYDAIFSWMDQFPERPVLGTCAGAILLASPGQSRSPYVRAEISRNAWGRQRDSFEAIIDVKLDVDSQIFQTVEPAKRDRFSHMPLEMASQAAQILSTSQQQSFPGVFIRAPRFDAHRVSCEIVARLGEEIVGVLDGVHLAVTFHPELTLDRRFHRWLLERAKHFSEVV